VNRDGRRESGRKGDGQADIGPVYAGGAILANVQSPGSAQAPRLSDLLADWLAQEEPRTLGGLVEAFDEKSFAIVFTVLLSVPALPLPTGGVTHVFEAIAMLVALQLVIGRRSIWLPERWKRIDLRGGTGERFTAALVRRIRWFERFSHPRWAVLTRGWWSRTLFGALVFVFSLAAFVAPPFSGLDTLPALGVVVMSLGVLFADFLLVATGTLIGWAGVAAVVGLGGIIVRAVDELV
jgi:hypothetical protein